MTTSSKTKPDVTSPKGVERGGSATWEKGAVPPPEAVASAAICGEQGRLGSPPPAKSNKGHTRVHSYPWKQLRSLSDKSSPQSPQCLSSPIRRGFFQSFIDHGSRVCSPLSSASNSSSRSSFDFASVSCDWFDCGVTTTTTAETTTTSRNESASHREK